MSNRDNFQWRPNDNSVTTNLRYSLEAEKWTKAFQSASTKSTANFSKDFFVIGLIFSLVINIIFLILMGVTDVIKWCLKKREEAIDKKRRTLFEEERKAAIKKVKIEHLKAKQKKLNLPTINRSERDPLFKKVALNTVKTQQISIPSLQIDLDIDFERACKIIDDLISAGIISKFNGKKPREVLIDSKETLSLLYEIEEESENN